MEDWALNGTGDTGAERQRGVKPKLQKSEELGYLGRFGTAHNSITAYRFTYPAPDMIWYHASLLYWPVTRPNSDDCVRLSAGYLDPLGRQLSTHIHLVSWALRVRPHGRPRNPSPGARRMSLLIFLALKWGS
nr:hypothetical protein Iba_chr09aCG5010 [Ipomoea batatas]